MIKQIGCAILFIAMAGTAAAGDKGKKCKKDCDPTTHSVKAPEIDATSATAALTLMAGGLAVVLGRRKKNLKA